jgi:hypothetical protein
MVNGFDYLNDKLRLGTELVVGGGGGGGGGPPASNLTAPNAAESNATHTHNFIFFTITTLPSAIGLNFALLHPCVSK